MPVPPVLPPTAPRTDEQSKVPSALVIDTEPNNARAADASANNPAGEQGARSAGTGGSNADARASAIRNRSKTIPIGTLIPIVLETPIDTARPGLVRAVTSTDTRGFDGRRVLVPRGSRLVGEYQADVRPGQNRVLVNWTRLIRPDGVTIQLASPTADELGAAGVPGQVHSFFFQRFAGALLQSALAVGVNLASRPRAGSVVIGIPSGPISAIGQNLVPSNELRPKITVKQGAVLNVFVARDLDFTGPEASGAR